MLLLPMCYLIPLVILDDLLNLALLNYFIGIFLKRAVRPN
jgi:hypothetical protein